MEASEGWERTRVDIDLMDVGFGRNDDDDMVVVMVIMVGLRAKWKPMRGGNV